MNNDQRRKQHADAPQNPHGVQPGEEYSLIRRQQIAQHDTEQRTGDIRQQAVGGKQPDIGDTSLAVEQCRQHPVHDDPQRKAAAGRCKYDRHIQLVGVVVVKGKAGELPLQYFRQEKQPEDHKRGGIAVVFLLPHIREGAGGVKHGGQTPFDTVHWLPLLFAPPRRIRFTVFTAAAATSPAHRTTSSTGRP